MKVRSIRSKAKRREADLGSRIERCFRDYGERERLGGQHAAARSKCLCRKWAGAMSPGTDEIIIQACADQRTGYRDQPSCPFFDHFPAGLRGDALDNAWNEFVDDFFFEQLAADVDTGGAGGGDPGSAISSSVLN